MITSCSSRCRTLRAIALTIASCTCFAIVFIASAHADETASINIDRAYATTDWSAPASGVRLRVALDSTTIYTQPVTISLSLEALPTQTSAPVIIADDSAQIKLRLTDAASGDTHIVVQTLSGHTDDNIVLEEGAAWDSLISFRVDCDTRIVDFDRYNRDTVIFDNISLPVSVHESLPVGKYLAQVELYVPETESRGWHGLLVSPLFPVVVLPTDPEPHAQTFLFPRQYRFERGPIAVVDSVAMDTVSIIPSPNHYLTYHITSDIGEFVAPGLPVSPAVLLNTDVPLPHGVYPLLMRPKSRPVFVEGKLNLLLHYEVFENKVLQGCNCFRTLRDPQRVLWERDIEISITREQYDSLLIPEWEVYDYHTVIVPTRLERNLDDSLRFSTRTAHLREFRIPRGYRLSTVITFDSDAAIWQNHPPQTPLTDVPHKGTFDTLHIDIFAYRPLSDDSSRVHPITDTIHLWSGYASSVDRCSSTGVTESFYLKPAQLRPIRSLYIPGCLRMSDDLVLTACDTGLIEIALPRTPGTALVASVTVGENCWAMLPPDLAGVKLNPTSGSFIGDTLVCKFSLYECRVESTSSYCHDALYSRVYKIPLGPKLHRKLWELMQKQPVYLRSGTQLYR